MTKLGDQPARPHQQYYGLTIRQELEARFVAACLTCGGRRTLAVEDGRFAANLLLKAWEEESETDD